ncbi:MAG: hypothetical protein QOK29_2871 [Rhodospirillaceae bacterium]|jgi:hypothetical protein|nr:hypothetical protein [Rhodospirillaceae bacterium]
MLGAGRLSHAAFEPWPFFRTVVPFGTVSAIEAGTMQS